MLTQAALFFQHLWSFPVLPPAHSLLSCSVPLGIPARTIPRRGASVNTQGRWKDAQVLSWKDKPAYQPVLLSRCLAQQLPCTCPKLAPRISELLSSIHQSRTLPLVPVELCYWMLFKPLLSIREAMPSLSRDRHPSRTSWPLGRGISHSLSLCSHRNPDPDKSKRRGEGLDPADRVSRSSPPFSGWELDTHRAAASNSAAQSGFTSAQAVAAQIPAPCFGRGELLVPTSVTHFLLYCSGGIAVLNKVSKKGDNQP